MDGFLPRLPPPQCRAVEAALLRIEVGPDLHPQALSVAVLNILRLQAGRGPVHLAIDDLQWLDDGTAHVLAFALRRLRTEPIAMLATVRLGEPDRDPLVLSSIPVERRQQLRLGPLPMSELGVILQKDLAEPPAARQPGSHR